MEHILKRPDCILIFIKRAAADAHQLDRLVDGLRLAGVQHPPGLDYLVKDLRQGLRVYDVIVGRF